MSVQYSDVPAGGVVSVSPAIPQGMLNRVKQIMGVSKTLKIFSLHQVKQLQLRPKSHFILTNYSRVFKEKC